MKSQAREQRLSRPDGTVAIHREKPSRRLAPCRITAKSQNGMDQEWENDLYYGLLRRYETGSPLGGGAYAILSISALNEEARHDWREYQQIKNDLLGPEWEGLELYPAESRLKDPSNRFYLWCFPPGVVPWGLPGTRCVMDVDEALAPQRPFPLT